MSFEIRSHIHRRGVRVMLLKGKTVCVAGSSGFIASHLIDALKIEGVKKIVPLDIETVKDFI